MEKEEIVKCKYEYRNKQIKKLHTFNEWNKTTVSIRKHYLIFSWTKTITILKLSEKIRYRMKKN